MPAPAGLAAIGAPVLTGATAASAGPPVALAAHPNGKFLYAAYGFKWYRRVLDQRGLPGALTFVLMRLPHSQALHPQAGYR